MYVCSMFELYCYQSEQLKDEPRSLAPQKAASFCGRQVILLLEQTEQKQPVPRLRRKWWAKQLHWKPVIRSPFVPEKNGLLCDLFFYATHISGQIACFGPWEKQYYK